MGNAVASTLPSGDERRESRCHLLVTIMRNIPIVAVGVRTFALDFAEGDVQAFNQKFVAILEELSVDVTQKGIDLREYNHDYLNRLRGIGKAAYNKILPSTAGEYLKDKEIEEKQRGLSLTFQTPTEISFFWEMLYAGEPFSVETHEFWGFRHPIGRTYWGEFNFPDRIQLQGGIFSAIHHKLKYSQREVEQVAQLLHQVCQRLSLKLNLHLLENIIPIETICTNRLLELFHDPEFRYGIIHFACHCLASEGVYTPQAYLSLTTQQKKIEIELEALLAWQKYGFQNRPFVFLNACGSATPGQLLQTMNFPSGMLSFGAAGVIATACAIPDRFASAFASKFYELLLGKLENNMSVDIGEVLLETRLYFLWEYNNPLGLAYGLYACSNQKLRD
ncbi:CHAT domain-containing protein [Nostoc sp.]|uniref:CHAT domain-containing protein n=1 Tax=Nostoc sp. TaxID=1180 RepID=UPI002FF666D4